MTLKLNKTHHMQVSQRMRLTPPSTIDVLLSKYEGVATNNLASGGTFFGMSEKVRQYVLSLLRDDAKCFPMSKYGDVFGSHELRKLWANVIARSSGDKKFDDLKTIEELFPEHDFVITAGANQAFVNLTLMLFDPGDEVLLILPYYFGHFSSLTMTGVIPVCVPVDNRTFLPNVTDIERRITTKTKALVIVNPGNPSGVVYPKRLLDQVADVCQKHDIYLILDEAYREVSFEHLGQSVYSPPTTRGVIKMFTMSKAYGLAGWRVGGILYPKALSNDMRKVQATNPTHATRLSQAVACEALRRNACEVGSGATHIGQLKEVRDTFIEQLSKVYSSSTRELVIPQGAFYFFLPYEDDEKTANLTEDDDMRVIQFLLDNAGTLVLPGFIFGMPGFLRVGYAGIRPEDAQTAAVTLASGLQKLFESYEH